MKFLLFMGAASAGFSFGSCPTGYSTEPNFDASQYVGTWYEYQRDRDTAFEQTSECVTATYTAQADGDITVKNRGQYWGFLWQYISVEGEARCKTDGKCYVSFAENANLDQDPNYLVIDTDYTQYSIVYSCRESLGGLTKFEDLWVLSRTTEMSDEKYDSIKQIISE